LPQLQVSSISRKIEKEKKQSKRKSSKEHNKSLSLVTNRVIGWVVAGVQAHGVALTALGSCLDGCSVWRLLASARAAYSLFCSLRLHKQKRRKVAFPAAQAGARPAREVLVTNHSVRLCAELGEDLII
jgi:hypothetical protein